MLLLNDWDPGFLYYSIPELPQFLLYSVSCIAEVCTSGYLLLLIIPQPVKYYASLCLRAYKHAFNKKMILSWL